MQQVQRPTVLRTLPALLVILALAFAMPGAVAKMENGNGNDNNQGTVKVHDNETADPDEKNEPKVTCDFWIEGFNMAGKDGHIDIYDKALDKDAPPVLHQDYMGFAETEGDGYHFLEGPFTLPVGHYRVEVSLQQGHPGNEAQFAKTKTFKVEEGDCEEIPFFPSPVIGAIASVGAISAFIALRRRS